MVYLTLMIKSIYSQKTFRRLILLTVTAIIVMFSGYFFAQSGYKELKLSEKGKAWFTHQPLLTEIFALFEVGVVDLDSDNNLDVYTANHSGQQHFLHNNGSNGLSSDNAISQFGFDQDREFPVCRLGVGNRTIGIKI